MKALLRQHHISFKTAVSGILWAFSTQPNYKVHIFLATVVLSAAFFFGVTKIEFVILLFTIVLGLVVEMVNTAIESVCDLVTKEWRQEVKIAKDVSAGMMLTTAIGAVVVAALIFWPYIVG